jgi:hypothetical protein
MAFRYDGYARVRCKLELSDKRLLTIADFAGDPARFPRGAKVRFEFLFTFNGEIVDMSALLAPRLRILSTEDPDSALAIDSNNATAITIKGDVTQDQWDSGDPAMAHCTFAFDSVYTAEGAFTGTLDDGETKHWFIITAGAGADFLVCGHLISFDAGYNPAAGVPPSGGSGATITDIEAILKSALANVVRFQGNPAGASIELLAPGSGRKVKLACDDEGNFQANTQTTT